MVEQSSEVMVPGLTAPSTAESTDTDLYVSWSDYYQLIEDLATKVHQSQWEFNQIICLARGGLRVGDVLARIFDLPLAIMSTSSYRANQGRSQGGIIFSRDLTMTTANLGSHVLIVDDLVDSGVTLAKTLVWLEHKYGFYIEEMRTAVLWYKQCSTITPDYYSQYLSHNPWNHQPFERYEQMQPADLLTIEASA